MKVRTLVIALILSVGFLGLLSQPSVGMVAAASHTWTSTWSHGSNTWTHNGHSWTHNSYSWSYTNGWSWTQNQNQHSWSHSHHSWQQATKTVTASAPWQGGGYNNGGNYNGGYYNNGGQYNGGYYNGGYPVQCPPGYAIVGNGCIPLTPVPAPYCPTSTSCPGLDVTTQSAQSVSTVTQTVTMAPNSTVNVNPANYNGPSGGSYNQNYVQQSNGDGTLYFGLAALAVVAVLGVLAIVYAARRLRPQPIQRTAQLLEMPPTESDKGPPSTDQTYRRKTLYRVSNSAFPHRMKDQLAMLLQRPSILRPNV